MGVIFRKHKFRIRHGGQCVTVCGCRNGVAARWSYWHRKQMCRWQWPSSSFHPECDAHMRPFAKPVLLGPWGNRDSLPQQRIVTERNDIMRFSLTVLGRQELYAAL